MDPRPLSLMERVLASFTMYSELKEATMDSEYEKVFARLQKEWTCIGGLVNTLLFVSSLISFLLDLVIQLVALAA